MRFIERADRQQEQAGFCRQSIAEHEVDVCLLEFNLARCTVSCERMFEFEFGEKADAVGELVAEEQHEAMEIDLSEVACAVIGIEIVVMQFAVAADRGARSRRGRRDRFDVVAGRFNFLVGHGELGIGGRELLPELGDLLLLLLHDRPDLFDARRLRPRWRRAKQCGESQPGRMNPHVFQPLKQMARS